MRAASCHGRVPVPRFLGSWAASCHGRVPVPEFLGSWAASCHGRVPHPCYQPRRSCTSQRPPAPAAHRHPHAFTRIYSRYLHARSRSWGRPVRARPPPPRPPRTAGH